jgi:endonuclease YncB( thermonuclease family)
MKKYLSILLVCAALVLGNTAVANTLQGRVVGVSDGDTVTVLDADNKPHKIRLSGIDAPEKEQAYGQKSKESLSELVFGKSVDVEWRKQDRYGRTVGKIMLGGVDICLEQLKRGMAWHYKQYQQEQTAQDRLSYAESETLARSMGTGLWQDAEPVEPSVFRHKK